MSKVKYYYDPDTLSYRKIEAKKSRRYRNIALFFIGSLLFGLLGLILLLNTNLINTPQELSLTRELNNYELQFELLDKKMEQIEDVLANIEDRDNNIYRLYFEANPIPEEQRRAGFGGINRYKSLEGFNNSEMVIATTERLDIIKKQMTIQSKSLDEITKLAAEKEKLLAAIPAIQPINNEELTRMASGFGWYSLAGILMGDAFGPVFGGASFLIELMRELVALVAIPLFIRSYPCTAIGYAGATAMDFTLPVIQNCGGIRCVPIAIVSGFILSLLVPFLMLFFVSL
mgnify:CR=1 FL=1